MTANTALVEWVNFGAPRWFGHLTRMNEDEFVKCVKAGLKE